MGAVQAQNDTQFKTVNNLLSLQDNHVEEFFQYHGQSFMSSLEVLMEDVTKRVVSEMLSKLTFTTNGGVITLNQECLREYEKITQENIEVDISKVLESALNTEVINQRKMAKQQYLESQGFGGGVQPTAVAALAGVTGNMQQYQQMQGATQNGTGYPIPPNGQDGYGRPYWIDQQTGQMSYEPPSSGLHLGSAIQKGAAWAKWLM